MASVSDLPADLQAKVGRAIAPTHGPSGRAFIGSATKEYQGKAEEKGQAPGEAKGEVFAPAPPKEMHTCPRCKVGTIEDQNFCPVCGLDNKKQRAADALGVKITDEDVQDYLFKGHIVKSVPFLEKHSLLFKTSQSREVDEADKLTEKHFEGRRPTDIEWLSYRSKILVAFGWVKMNGSSIGNTVAERLEYIDNHGSQLLEIVAKKYKLFTDAIAEVLNGDTLGK